MDYEVIFLNSSCLKTSFDTHIAISMTYVCRMTWHVLCVILTFMTHLYEDEAGVGECQFLFFKIFPFILNFLCIMSDQSGKSKIERKTLGYFVKNDLQYYWKQDIRRGAWTISNSLYLGFYLNKYFVYLSHRQACPFPRGWFLNCWKVGAMERFK